MSLTLNDTPTTDNQALFVLELSGEGANLIGNSAFTTSTGWTLGADWAISGGTLNYVYSTTTNGIAKYDVGAGIIDDVPYVLEYEVKYIHGAVKLTALGGAFTSLMASDVQLDISLGKHSVTFMGDSTGRYLYLRAHEFTTGESLWLDNVKIRKESNSIYLSTREITLDSTTFYANAMQFNSLSDIDSGAAVENGGGYGQLTGFTFGITRYSPNTELSDFFNEFFPSYNGGILYGRQCKIGVVWADAITLGEITWLMRGRITKHTTRQRDINITVLQESNLDAREIPYYSIQKDFDNGVSYYENAPDDNYGGTIPIVYGDFSGYYDEHLLFKPITFPLVCADKTNLIYLCASHKFKEDDFHTGGGASVMYQYISGLETYMTMTCVGGSSTNSNYIGLVTNYDTLLSTDNQIIGTLNIHPTIPGTQAVGDNDFKNVIDDSDSTTKTLTAAGSISAAWDKLALMIGGSTSDLGQLSRASGSIELYAIVTAADAVHPIYGGYYNSEYNSGAGGSAYVAGIIYGGGTQYYHFDISQPYAGARDVTDEPWSWGEICSLEYVVGAQRESGDPDPSDLTIEDFWLNITNIVVSQVRFNKKDINLNRGSLRNNIGGR